MTGRTARTLDTKTASRVTLALGRDHEPELIAALLRARGHDASLASSGSHALRQLRENATELLIVDAQLDGFDVQQRLIQERCSVGLLFIGNDSTSPTDRVRALANGADDFVTRPFDPEEFVERVRSILRRAGQKSEHQTVVRYGDLEIDVATHEARRSGTLLNLTMTEFRLLHYLASNAPQVLSKRQIVEQVWGYDFDGDYSVVETFISYLRRKVNNDSVPLIRTVRGLGYAMAPIKQLPATPDTGSGGLSSTLDSQNHPIQPGRLEETVERCPIMVRR
jgi:two-component system, OmpR family, response regulator